MVANYQASDIKRMWIVCTQSQTTETKRTEKPASLSDELNIFYARFENSNTFFAVKFSADENKRVLNISLPEVYRTFRAVNPRKSPGPDGVLKACASQLAEVFTYIFNLSLTMCVIPFCFKTIIISFPKKHVVSWLNDYRPVALTSTIMNSFEQSNREEQM